MNEVKKTSYELLVVVPGSLKESEVKKELAKWKAETEKIGKILNEVTWPNRPLAYKIKHETTGTYFIAHFEAEAAKIPAFDNALRLDAKVLRHFVAKTPKDFEWCEYEESDLENDPEKIKAAERKAAAPKKPARKPARR